MRRRRARREVEWVVVGGGIHGTYVARELLEAGVPREELAVLDSHGELLTSFRRKARACGMDTLRSNYVQHIGPSPFGLQRFAEARNREDELVPTRNSQPRPTLDLFFDYADQVIERFDLDELVSEATVTDVEADGSLVVDTTAGAMRAERLVLAVGQGERYRRPAWTRGQPRVEHVWEDATRPVDAVEDDETVWVVGGGITAGQVATTLADRVDSITLCTRHPIREALREADPRWLNWNYIEDELHTLPAGSKARFERLRRARNGGTMPPYLTRELETTPNVTVRRDEIEDVVRAADGLLASCRREGGGHVDRILLATGFEPVFEHPFVRSLVDSLSLQTGHRGMPVLDDETLAWRTESGESSRVLATGKLAEGTVGPFAGNIPGARRAAERIVEGHPTEVAKPA